MAGLAPLLLGVMGLIYAFTTPSLAEPSNARELTFERFRICIHERIGPLPDDRIRSIMGAVSASAIDSCRNFLNLMRRADANDDIQAQFDQKISRQIKHNYSYCVIELKINLPRWALQRWVEDDRLVGIDGLRNLALQASVADAKSEPSTHFEQCISKSSAAQPVKRFK